MSSRAGVPVEGGLSDVFVRERASATPKRPIAPSAKSDAPIEHTATGPLATTPRTEPSPMAAPLAPQGTSSQPFSAPLAALQRWFAAITMDPSSVAAGIEHARRAGTLAVPADQIERVVLPSSRLSAEERLAIYRDAYHARLVECLADDYPALQYALGEGAFERLCLRYIARHPSELPNLNFFGRHMAAFCREDAARRPSSVDDAAYNGDFAAELAALEWAMVEVLHAPTAGKLELAELATIPAAKWAGARFTSSGSVRLFEFEYPVNAYFQAFRNDEEPSVPGRETSAIAVFRDGATIWRMTLNPAMHGILVALYQGLSLGDALEKTAEQGHIKDDEAGQIMVWFRDWVAHGFFAGIDIG